MLKEIIGVFLAISTLSSNVTSKKLSFANSEINSAIQETAKEEFTEHTEEDYYNILGNNLAQYYYDNYPNSKYREELHTFAFGSNKISGSWNEFQFADSGSGSGGGSSYKFEKISGSYADNGAYEENNENNDDVIFEIVVEKETIRAIYNSLYDFLNTLDQVTSIETAFNAAINLSFDYFLSAMFLKFGEIGAQIVTAVASISRTLALILVIVEAAVIIFVCAISYLAHRGNDLVIGLRRDGFMHRELYIDF